MARATEPAQGWAGLLSLCRTLPFEPHDIAAHLDAGGRYDMPLDEEFPFAIPLFHYRTDQHTRGSTWHERLELFVPLDGRTLFRMGEQRVRSAAGRSPRRRQPEAAPRRRLRRLRHRAPSSSASAPSSSTASARRRTTTPSCCRSTRAAARRARVLPLPEHPGCRQRAPAAGRCAGSRSPTARCSGPDARRSCWSCCSSWPGSSACPSWRHWEFLRQQQRSLRLKPLFDHVSEHYAEKLTVAEAAGAGAA